MSAAHERILIGSNRIRAYIGDQLHWEIVPHGFSMLQTDISGTLLTSNPVSGDKTVTYKLWRLGSLRILNVGNYDQTMAAATCKTAALAALDWPAADVYEDVVILDNTNTLQAGRAILATSDGCITVAATVAGGNYSAAPGGWKSFMMMYDTAAHHNSY